MPAVREGSVRTPEWLTSCARTRDEIQGGFGGGPLYTTYAATQLVVGGYLVLRAPHIIDSGWIRDQRLVIANTTVNCAEGVYGPGDHVADAVATAPRKASRDNS